MNKIIKTILIILIFCTMNVVMAEDRVSDRNYAKSLLNGMEQKIQTFELAKEVPNFDSNPKETQIDVGQIHEQAKQETAKSEAAKEISKNYDKKDQKFSKFTDEQWFKDSLKITDNPNNKLKEFGIGCDQKKMEEDTSIKLKPYQKTKGKTISKLDIATCEEPGEKTFDCDRELQLTCRQSDDCDNGGVLASSVTSDMKWEYSYPYLTVGTIADNYWGGWCQTYDRVTKFQVRNKEKVTEFKIMQVGFDDYLWIKVNGHTVYVGPDGGSHVEVTGSGFGLGVSNGHGKNSCERNTNWNFGLDIDLKPYLLEGENEIFMRVIVAGAGEGWMKIIAKQHCCKEWIETWDNKCEKELNTILQ